MPKKPVTTKPPKRELVKVEVIQEERDISAQLIQGAKAIVSKAEKFSDKKLVGGRFKTFIHDQAELDKAGAVMTELAAQIKAINSKHKELKAPFLEGGRKLDAFFFGPRDILQTWLDDLKEAARQHLIRVDAKRKEEEAKQEEARRKEQEKLDEKLEKARADGNEKAIAKIEQKQEQLSAEIAVPVTPQAELATGVGTRKKFIYKVLNFGKMPDSFQGFQLKVENASVLQKIANDSNGLAKIPGVAFEEDFGITVQGKK